MRRERGREEKTGGQLNRMFVGGNKLAWSLWSLKVWQHSLLLPSHIFTVLSLDLFVHNGVKQKWLYL